MSHSWDRSLLFLGATSPVATITVALSRKKSDENWQLMATKVDIRRPLYGKDPCPEGELWLRDSDIVVIPKHPILVIDEFIELVFTRGVYGVLPFSTNLSFVRDLSGVGGIVPIP